MPKTRLDRISSLAAKYTSFPSARLDQIVEVTERASDEGCAARRVLTARAKAPPPPAVADAPLVARASEDEVARARDLHGSDNLEVDDDAAVSRAVDGGVWVAAWVWLPGDEEEAKTSTRQ